MLAAISLNPETGVRSPFHSKVNKFLSLEFHPFIMSGHLGCRPGSVETRSQTLLVLPGPETHPSPPPSGRA